MPQACVLPQTILSHPRKPVWTQLAACDRIKPKNLLGARSAGHTGNTWGHWGKINRADASQTGFPGHSGSSKPPKPRGSKEQDYTEWLNTHTEESSEC